MASSSVAEHLPPERPRLGRHARSVKPGLHAPLWWTRGCQLRGQAESSKPVGSLGQLGRDGVAALLAEGGDGAFCKIAPLKEELSPKLSLKDLARTV